MNERLNVDNSSVTDIPYFEVDDEYLLETTSSVSEPAANKVRDKASSDQKIRKSIEDIKESKRLHGLIDDYDFDGLDDD